MLGGKSTWLNDFEVQTNFTKVPNELIKADIPGWSLRILIYMLSRPDDWIFQPSAMGAELNIKRETMYQYLNRLKTMKLIEKDSKYKWKISDDFIQNLTHS